METGIIIHDYQGTMEVSIEAYLLERRKIFLNGMINNDMADNLLKKAFYLFEVDAEKEINIYLNSSGGEITAGMSIIDFIRNAIIPINIYVTGEAASMAAVILACGKKGRRYLLPHARTMIHEPLLSGSLYQKASSLQDMSESLMQTKIMLNKILAIHTEKSLEEINELTQHDHWMNAKESIRFGLADKIIENII